MMMKFTRMLTVLPLAAALMAAPALADGHKDMKGKSGDAYGQAVKGAEGKDAKKDAAQRHMKEKMEEMEKKGKGKK